MTTYSLIALTLLSGVPDISHDGVVSGNVVNGSRQAAPVEGAKVVLQLKSRDQFNVFDTLQTDSSGFFIFRGLMVSDHIEYKLAAQHGGVHYPGPRFVLTRDRKSLATRIMVRDTITHPNPLVVRQHVVRIVSDTGLLRVTEALLIDNPTERCYVGPEPAASEDTVTLRLSIPRDFIKVTFHKEFFGRAFAVKEDALVTGLPWEPGQRELAFTYILANESGSLTWQRPLDLPTENLTLAVDTNATDELSCSLDDVPLPQVDSRDAPTFAARGATLKSGAVIQLTLGKLPIAWTVYARWSIVIVLAVIVVASVLRRMRTVRRRSVAATPPTSDHAVALAGKRARRRTRRSRDRTRRRAA